jgi:hypothetical protein
MKPRFNRGRLWCSMMLLAAPLLSACEGGGHFNILGYTTRPNYDCCLRTIYVPIFQNVTFQRGLEFDLTRAVIREIESKTPYKVVSCRENADTELLGKIVTVGKSVINFNQLGEVRDAEARMGVEIVWRDLRPGHTGEILSTKKKDDDRPDAKPLPSPPIALVQPTADFIPELGGSLASAQWALVERTAVQIVSMMEKPW